MAGPGGWKGSIQFGPMVNIPVVAKSAVREEKIAFNTHHDPSECKGAGGRIRATPGICEECGETVERDQTVRGFKGVPGVDESYIESLQLEKSQVMELDRLVPASQVDPRFYEKSYDVIPEKGAERPYMLLVRLLEAEQRIAIGKVVAGGKEHIVALRPRGGVLAMELLYWPEEVEAAGTALTATKAVAGVEVTDQELEMARQLAKFMAGEFEPDRYENGWSRSMAEYLTSFVAGQTPKALPKRQEQPVATMDLAAALSASLTSMKADAKAKAAA